MFVPEKCEAQDLHQRLAHFNHRRLTPGKPDREWMQTVKTDILLQLQEEVWIQTEREAVARVAATAPTDPSAFVAWFERLREDGDGQHHLLFAWLHHSATEDQMRWFLTQEAAGEAGFDDLVALTQIKMPKEPKLELAWNYWEEMGNGNEPAMHGPMLEALMKRLNIRPTIEGTVWESLALANTMVAFAVNPRYRYHAIGALGVIELTAPTRVKEVAEGLKRLGFNTKETLYFDTHATVDLTHSERWNAHVLRPLVASDPDCARFIAEGALIRLRCGLRCFERYTKYFLGEQEQSSGGDTVLRATGS
jgi:hypothetical protein